jgi:tetratricopeptide (TPR) repeat protein
MSEQRQPFFRKVAGQMLDAETERHIAEQQAALEKNPDWAEGYYHLAQLYRVHHFRQEEAKRLLLVAVEKKPALAEAHLALGEIYIAEGDLERARQHAEFAAQLGHDRLRQQMRRHGALPGGG